MHRRMQALPDTGFCIRYIFAYFDNKQKGTNRYIIASYLKAKEE